MKKIAGILIVLFTIVFSACNMEPETYENILVKETIKAQSANKFLNSIGVNSSITKRGEYLYQTIDYMNYLGARWIRGGYSTQKDLEDIITVYKATGAKICIGVGSGGNLNKESMKSFILQTKCLAEAGALLAFEGPNEPNNWKVTYNGELGGGNGNENTWKPIAELMKDLCLIVGEDDVLKNYPVFHTCENGAETENLGLQFCIVPEGTSSIYPAGTKFADYANCHNYASHPSWPGIHDNQTWRASDPSPDSFADGLYSNYGSTWLNGYSGYDEKTLLNIPRVTTETGITVGEQGSDNLSEEMQGCMYMNIYLSQFKRGWSYTAVYLLKAHGDEANHEPFSFFNLDGSGKIAADYLHNLTSILADDPNATTNPGYLTFSIPNKPATVHHLLLQKSNGNLELVVWGEKYTGGSEKIRVNFDETFKVIRIFDPTQSSDEIETLYNVNSILLTMTTHPYVIEIEK
ncbi:glycosyl hydrolase [Coprobacter secundus]|uniref:Glycosyl hydrolase n=1 Tax=Coprobacter secundus subsp. similis TaxID=2751153 RepID=A0A7G1HVR6_9BACT|nr:glycosyl hydrolase [Coprobacter secundus]BCI63789.1 hypothetical protein Cop2CBH44_21420 [Coprobacter secundus subsp. similis]